MKIVTLYKVGFVILTLTFSLAIYAGEKVFCSLCLTQIEGGYIRFKDGDEFCKSCMKEPKCVQCGKPSKGTLHGEVLCSKCIEQPNTCGLCNKVVGRKFVVFPLSERKFCKECTVSHPRCRFCSAPTNKKASYGMRWAMCSECQGRMIVGVDAMKNILSEVESIITSNIHLSLNSQVGLEVCSNITKEGRGMNGDEMGLMQQLGGTSVILIQDGMPIEIVYETLAHEWAHAWLAQNGGYKISLKIEEGFCQWVASKVLIDKGYDASLNILRNRADTYGAGYRKIEKVEIARGVDGVVKSVLNSKPGLLKKLFGKKR